MNVWQHTSLSTHCGKINLRSVSRKPQKVKINVIIQPAYAFAQQFGVKAVVYGPPGSGKTPLVNTAPLPILCCVESGMLSMRTSSVPTVLAQTCGQLDEFFLWLLNSKEAGAFSTVCVDSFSQIAETILRFELGENKDPRKAYGKMSAKVMTYANQLYFSKEKNVYIICKEDSSDTQKKPYFPGKDVNTQLPHLYDVILHMDRFNIPQQGSHVALRTKSSETSVARDRSGKLFEYEQPNLTNIFNKIMSKT